MKRFSNPVARMLILGMLMVPVGSAVAQQAYPNKPIRFLVPYASGGSPGILTHLIALKLAERLGQAVIVDFRPGGNTTIGADALAKSPPDGYTIMTIATTHVIVPNLVPTPYDAIKDFAPVATLATTEYILVSHPSLAANNLKELIALAKSKPGQLTYASSAAGSTTHLAAELFDMMTGVKMLHVPYKGAGPAITDLLGGHVHLFFASPISVVPLIKSGQLKALAITGDTRLPALPQVPSFTEAGLPGLDVKTWLGVLAPAGTPEAIIDRLSSEFAKILVMPDVKETLTSQGLDPFISTPDQFAALMKADMAKFGKVIKTANIRIED
jgi:tripartite-type tricarboxylate transporter receptor subunit TctC